MATQEQNLGIVYGWEIGESGYNLEMDQNLLTLATLTLLSVKSATTTATPASPGSGDRYIIPPVGVTGAWAGEEGNLALFTGTEWVYFVPKDAWETVAVDTGQRYTYDGAAWQLWASRLGQYADDISAGSAGVPVGGTYVNASTGAMTVRLS